MSGALEATWPGPAGLCPAGQWLKRNLDLELMGPASPRPAGVFPHKAKLGCLHVCLKSGTHCEAQSSGQGRDFLVGHFPPTPHLQTSDSPAPAMGQWVRQAMVYICRK